MANKNLIERLLILKGNMSTRAFARLVDIGESSIRGYLNGSNTPPVEKLLKIAKPFKTTVEWLYSGKMPNIKDIDNKCLSDLYRADPEVIDIESDKNKIFPVVRTYDDLKSQLHFYCIHCGKWHQHGRGGPDEPLQLGREGYGGGHRISHCLAENSPFKVRGVILEVVGEFTDEIKNQKPKETPCFCHKCKKYYSTALNACSCGFINKKRRNKYPYMLDIYMKCAYELAGNEKQEIDPKKNQHDQNTSRPPEINNAEPSTENQWSISEMLVMTTEVLESKTSYRSALAANIRAFHEAVKNEEGMEKLNEKLDKLLKENRAMAERMARMEKRLNGFEEPSPQKREQNAG
ncbi:helix-turn-helix domain-containing protein [Desulforhopalus singaporensis]|uniref:Helix-turn-helix domain-containing protein n=1 Tax=Desulforhopalus singaporensis TaxID=91360 RepID=A0A1H0RJ35_9BACT|nr:helix-turn-helix transcriptional regulator [Desulforhopalus singaporensis]SDP29219.1 Helix-turn-helix domain-containing protein [Desulforhopalus singaporensis]